MTTFTINDAIFSQLRDDVTIDRVALQNLVDAINKNSYSNSVVSAAAERGDSVFEVAKSVDLDKNHAGAMYSNDRGSGEFSERGNKFAYQLDEKWFRPNGAEPALLADPRNARAVLGVVTHEVDHNAHQSMYDEALRLRDTPPEAYRPDLTGAARSAASVDLAMRAEVSGWYADLNTQRAEVASGRMSLGEFNARNSPMTIGGHLLQIESQGKAQGLTGDGLTQYLAEHGRQVLPSNYMPDYINSFGKGDADPIEVRKAMGYALNDPNGLKSIVQEVGPDGTYISTSEYNNGQRVTRTNDGYKDGHTEITEVLQPDGSYRALERCDVLSYNTDGSYGDQVKTSFDTDGRATRVTETDGAHNDADYASRTTTYDAQGRVDFTDTYRDDGSRNHWDSDQDGSQGWTQSDTHFDAQGREDWRRTVNDDGSVDWRDIDQANQYAHSIWSNHTDAQGREDWRNITLDDGSRDWTDFDQTNVDVVNFWASHFDAQGREDVRIVNYDDGSKDQIDFDQANQRADSIWSNHIDVQGREDWRRSVNDDGSVDWFDIDQTNQYAHSTWSNHTDAQGREDWRNVILDDGSRDWTDFDQSNARADNVITSHYDVQGREDWRSVINDNGRRDWTDFDQDGSQGWNRAESHYDAQGREDYTDFFMDDGRRNSYDFDQDGSRSWSRFESNFDASGHLDTSTRVFDDGSRLFIDFDRGGLGHDAMRGYNARGQQIFAGEHSLGLVRVINGWWNPAYEEGLNVEAFAPLAGSDYFPPYVTWPTSTFGSGIDVDPYPNAYVEVGPIEPAW